jgi:5-methylcytosine-specific restriction protein B
MYSALRIGDFVFDTWAIQTAYGRITPEVSSVESEYDEESLRTLLELFCDWGPARTSSLNDSAVDSLDQLGESEKRDLYQRCCSQIAENLTEQYSYDATEADVRRFAEALTIESNRKNVADFLLSYVWQFSQQLHEFDPSAEETEDAQALLNAIRNLPAEYREIEKERYADSQKVNRVRYRILGALHEGGDVPIARLDSFVDEEEAKFDSDVFRSWNNYRILGQLYFDFFKPRIDGYLDRLANYLAAELDVTNHEIHTVHFTEPRNFLSDFAWIAIHPGKKSDQRDEHQLYLGVHWNRLTYGLHVGGNLRDEEGWKRDRDLEQVQDSENASVDAILSKLRAVKSDYLKLNGIPVSDDPPEKPSRADEIARQLDSTNQVVFYGPPGTGKTYVAQQFARWWTYERTGSEPLDEQVQTVTFHPSFSYEDFLEGLTAEVQNGNVTYEIDDGVFKRIAETARDAYRRAKDNDETPPPYVLIVDEINRGNLAQIFGETVTQLESDKRLDQDNETVVRLAHSDDSFVVPPNLYLVGTMNTADRSIALVDAALRRRFRFVSFPPAFDEVVDHYDLPADPVENGDDFEALLGLSVAALRELNDRITKSADLGKGKQIGHARLFGLSETRDLRDAWRYDILPLLEEYYFGQFDRIRQELFDDNGEELFDWERERVRDFTTSGLAEALGKLVNSKIELSGLEDDSGGSASRRRWDRDRFFDEVESEFAPEIVEAYEALYEFASSEADEVGYGTGSQTGAMQAYWDEYHDSSNLVFEARTDGNVQFRFWDADEGDIPVFEHFVENVAPLVDEQPDPEFFVADKFNQLRIPIERLTDEEAMEQFRSTVTEFVEDYADHE